MLIIAAMMASVEALMCLNYQCNEGTTNNQCATFTQDAYKLTLCNSSSYCTPLPITSQTSHCKLKSVNLLPGEYCDNDSQCLSKKCTDLVCKGKEAEAACSTDADCDVELYCGSNKKCARPSERCSPTMKCLSSQFCFEGACRNYGTVKVGERAGDRRMCESYYMFNGVCDQRPKLDNKGKRECPASGTCWYKSGNRNVEGECVCGKSHDSKHFCPPGLGDIYVNDVSAALQS